MNEYNTKLNNYFNYIKTNNNKIQKNKNNNELVDKLNKQNELYQSKINEINNIINQNLQNEKQLDNNGIYKTYKSNKICLDIETDKEQNILQIAYNIYDNNNILLCSKDFYIYDGIHSKPFYPTINEEDIIKKGISLKDASDIITMDINNTDIIIGHNIIQFDLVHINKLNAKFDNNIKNNIIIHDTMKESKNIVNAKDKIGRLKNPRLEEMLIFLCNKSVENYHNALGDIIATFDCYKILCDKYKCFQ